MKPLSYRDWLRKTETAPVVWPAPPPPQTIIRVRCIPAVYAQHAVKIEDGEPFAEISLNSSLLSFPAPFEANGHPTVACHEWLTEAVSEAIRRDGHLRIIIWPDISITTFTQDGQPTLRRPSANHEAQHG
jgi:hypothetical protein